MDFFAFPPSLLLPSLLLPYILLHFFCFGGGGGGSKYPSPPHGHPWVYFTVNVAEIEHKKVKGY